ncbi:hypothetical protein [Flavobacterium sp. JP2137]|uniref:hypothetical protein n=1 Tax=Flavobacterium sp. JP2137 TaxID=3414510 RepID=UPI003D300D6F
MGQIAISEQQQLVSIEMNAQITAVLSNKMQDFQKAFVMAGAIERIRELLTPEVMKPIMALQGSKLGFRTDKDKTGGYTMLEVKECLIESLLLGLQPYGNEWNIIGGNMYPTREGFGSVLDKIEGLRYNISYPKIIQSQDKLTANVVCKIDWQLNGDSKTQTIDFPVKSNAYATADALIGKAERKSRRWLYNHIKGTDISDGDATDVDFTVVSSKPLNKEEIIQEKEKNRMKEHIAKATKLSILHQVKSSIPSDDLEIQELYSDKEDILSVEAIHGVQDLETLSKLSPLIEKDEHIIMLDDKKKELEQKAKNAKKA